MPEMNGGSCERAQRRRPSCGCVHDGYTRDAIVHNGTLDPGTHLVSKPFTIGQLGVELEAPSPRPRSARPCKLVSRCPSRALDKLRRRTLRLLLEKGSRCWKVAAASRARCWSTPSLLRRRDGAMTRARRSIHFLNWAFEPDTGCAPSRARRAQRRWHSSLPEGIGRGRAEPRRPHPLLAVGAAVAATQKFFPIVDRSVFAGSRVKFVLDGEVRWRLPPPEDDRHR